MLAVSGAAALAATGPTGPAGGAVVTQSDAPGATRSSRTTTNAADAARTGWYPEEPGLGPDDVTAADFGIRWRARVDGQVYAQPLAWGGTVLIVTAANMAYGLDQATGALRWSRSLDPPVRASDLRCSDLAPLIGVTSTPVIDPATNVAYAVTKTVLGGRYAHRVHALDLATGEPRPGFPVAVAGTASNDPARVFDSTWQHQRAGLALLDGTLWLAFGAHCDLGRYTGWMVGIGTDGRVASLWTAYAGTTGSGAGIWQSGSAPASDGPGRMFITTGNGFGARSGQFGAAPPDQLAQSVVRLDVGPGPVLRAADFFSPYDAPRLDRIDADLGASSPVVLPAVFGTPRHRDLLLQSSKTGYLYLLDRGDLGGRGTGASGGDRVLSRVGPDGGQWGKSAVWPGEGGWIYTVTNTRHQLLLAHQVVSDASGRPRLVRRAASAEAFGKLSGTPVVTSDGTDPGTAVVWAVQRDGRPGASELRAYAARPEAGRLRLLWRGAIGDAVKFSSPLPVDGQVVVASLDGTVTAFGRPALAPAAAPVPSAPADASVSLEPDVVSLGGIPVGADATATLTLTNTTDGPVALGPARISASAGAVASVESPAPGTAVPAGGSVAIPVRVRAVRSGEITAELVIETAAGARRATVTATAGAAGRLSAGPLRIDLGTVGVGSVHPVRFQVANRGGSPLSVTRSKGPTAADGWTVATDLVEGTTLAPGAAVTVTGTFTARRTGPVELVWTLNADAARSSVTVRLTARVVP